MWEFLDLESECRVFVCWPNNKIIASSSGERRTSALIPFSECFGPFRNSETKRQLHATMHQAAGESYQAIGWIDDPRVMFSLGLAAATCRSHLVSLTWWPFDNTGQSSREPSPRISSHTRTCPFHRTPRGKQARRTTWGPSFWQTIMWTILGLVVLQFLRVEISNPEPQIGLKEVLTPGTLTVWHVTDQWIS